MMRKLNKAVNRSPTISMSSFTPHVDKCSMNITQSDKIDKKTRFFKPLFKSRFYAFKSAHFNAFKTRFLVKNDKKTVFFFEKRVSNALKCALFTRKNAFFYRLCLPGKYVFFSPSFVVKHWWWLLLAPVIVSFLFQYIVFILQRQANINLWQKCGEKHKIKNGVQLLLNKFECY